MRSVLQFRPSFLATNVLAPFAIVMLLLGGCKRLDVFDPTVPTSRLFRDPRVVELVEAARRGDIDTVDKLVTSGVDPNARGYDNVTPLFVALVSGNQTGYSALLRHGADPNVIAQFGMCVVNRAAETDDPYFLREALLHGGNPSIVNEGTRRQPIATPLWYAITGTGKYVMREIVRTEHVRLLLAAGANANEMTRSRNGDGFSMVATHAALNQSYSALLQLLRNGGHFEGAPREFMKKHALLNIERSASFIHRTERYSDQRLAYLKVVDFLNAQGAGIALDPEIRKAIEAKIDRFTAEDIDFPQSIEFDGTTYTLANTETSLLDAITLNYKPEASEPSGPERWIEITLAPDFFSPQTEAAARKLEFRVAHPDENPQSKCTLTYDNEGGLVVHQNLTEERFEMAFQNFQPLKDRKGYQRFAYFERIPAQHSQRDALIDKLQADADSFAERWKKFSPPIQIVVR